MSNTGGCQNKPQNKQKETLSRGFLGGYPPGLASLGPWYAVCSATSSPLKAEHSLAAFSVSTDSTHAILGNAYLIARLRRMYGTQ